MSDFATVTYLLRASAAQGPGFGTRPPRPDFYLQRTKSSPDNLWDPPVWASPWANLD
ncbi:hypothetical protein GBA52_001506 [Prunus armeniaca]|nr:hypothetical protein GBA52_001506 [Prunus armeniaca]